MTRRAFGALTRHFVGAIVEPPMLTDIGVDAFRRTLFTIVAFFLSLGLFLPRFFRMKYVTLSEMPSAGPYERALQGDTLIMITIPMFLIGLAAVIVSPMLFPDETDYRVLTPLPMRRIELFGAKFAALVIVATVGVATINAVASLAFPLFAGGRWARHGLMARVITHALSACLATAWMVSAVMALQGLCLLAVPERWRHRVATTLQAAFFLLLLISLPLLVRLTGARFQKPRPRRCRRFSCRRSGSSASSDG